MKLLRRFARLASPLVAPAYLCHGCDAGHNSGVNDADAAALGPATTVASDAGAKGWLDAGAAPTDAIVVTLPPGAADNCMPGTYDGMSKCNANGLPIWGGTTRFTLESMKIGSGEFSELSIVPGTRLSGQDDYAGKFDAEQSGTFVCSTGLLQGMIDKGLYTSWFGAPATMRGPMSGTYRAADAGAAPGFDGEMGPITSADGNGLGLVAQRTWSATRESLAVDAGLPPVDAGQAARDAGQSP